MKWCVDDGRTTHHIPCHVVHWVPILIIQARHNNLYICIAPEASLCGLPDNILLSVMQLLDVHSLICLSRVCRRFHHLHRDDFIWSDVDLTLESLRTPRLDVRKLKKIVHTYLPPSLRSIKLSSNRQSKNPIVTEALLNDLFTQCPNITTIALYCCVLNDVRYLTFMFNLFTSFCII